MSGQADHSFICYIDWKTFLQKTAQARFPLLPRKRSKRHTQRSWYHANKGAQHIKPTFHISIRITKKKKKKEL